MHSFALIRGDEHDALQKHMKTSQNRLEVLKMAGFDMATSTLRDSYVDKLRSSKQEDNESCEKLKAWSEANSNKEKMAIASGRGVLNEAFRYRICIHRSSREYEQFRREVGNGCVGHCREYPSCAL